MPTSFKVMTWNLENLFLPGEAGSPDSQELFEQKLNTLAETILELSPDVLALQEVGSDASLRALQGKVRVQYPHDKLSDLPDERGIRVGFLSKLEFEDAGNFADFPAGPV